MMYRKTFVLCAISISSLVGGSWSRIRWNNNVGYVKSDVLTNCEQNVTWHQCKIAGSNSEVKENLCEASKIIGSIEKGQKIELIKLSEQICVKTPCEDKFISSSPSCFNPSKSDRANIAKTMVSTAALYMWSDKVSADDKKNIKTYYSKKWGLALTDPTTCSCFVKNSANVYCNLYEQDERSFIDKLASEIMIREESPFETIMNQAFGFAMSQWGDETTKHIENIKPQFSKVFLNTFVCPSINDLVPLIESYIEKDKGDLRASTTSITFIVIGCLLLIIVVVFVTFRLRKKISTKKYHHITENQSEWVTGGYGKKD